MAVFTAPVAGLIANRNYAMPDGEAQGAAVLENFFPTPRTAILRRGSAIHAQLSDSGNPVRSLFTYSVGNNQRMFAADDETIFDITTVDAPQNWAFGDAHNGDGFEIGEGDWMIGGYSVEEDRHVWTGAEGGDWHVVQFSTTGGTFLIGVNGASTGFIFEGMAFYPNTPGGVATLSFTNQMQEFTIGATVTGGTSGATGVIFEIIEGATPGEGGLIISNVDGFFQSSEALTDSEGGEATSSSDSFPLVPGIEFPDGLTTADMAFVWVYKNTLWFVQKESLTAWYMPVDSIGGEASRFDLGPEFGQGGSLLIGQSWSMSSSGQGGLSEQNVFLSTEGEAVVYQGLHPDVSGQWQKVGTYRVGAPLGRRGFIRAGGDLVICTTIGFVALSTAIQVDMAALAPMAVSYAIEDIWNEAATFHGREWVACLWPESQMVAIAPPAGQGEPLFYVSNARTGAWAKFTNWNATCMAVFQGGLYFGTPDGFVMQAMAGGTDAGEPFTGTYMPLFTDHGKPAIRKVAAMARSELISSVPVNESLSCRFDFDDSRPAAPQVRPVTVGDEWDNAVWNESIWNNERASDRSQRRHSASGSGYRIAPMLRVSSGSAVPLDCQIVSVEVTYNYGDIFS